MILQGTETEFIAEATDQTDRLIERLRESRAHQKRTMAWVHYLTPHQPYQTHEGFDFGASNRDQYRSEVAYVDAQLGRLFEYLQDEGWFEDSLVIVFADLLSATNFEAWSWGHRLPGVPKSPPS